ncbi:LysR family transcriptional regulator (chromosome initiation inhibitor) [Kushneria sinocarnis]|uniref:LysR family transcriptional regulator (Chromosome initiation inhibitor) n=1 Tax=Kushneria sinocarnis TaxID=595502 RepID=A0A420WUY1_9GAMM|nr:LysR family transcriptional regulator ArgP [Kushneria sinocarnis]RKQ97251.1 LysR family transcriptional regulator (chromosome initiation inhibitor) [Kushneria sinocarnis]
MLDYKLLEALGAVVDQAGFERGAQALGLTQSAVSQRIKLLESRLGQPVLVRAPRIAPTELGRRLLNHIQQVRLLEHDLLDYVPALGEREHRLRIALNADSLDTWWCEAVADFDTGQPLLFDLVVEDQETALTRMRDGEVAACLCATPRSVQGARARPLGGMRYLPVATPGFLERHFPGGITPDALTEAPGVVFGSDDRLHQRYIAHHGVTAPFPHHLCPSSEGFHRMIRAGLGYGLVPELQCHDALERGELSLLEHDTKIVVPLYWHYWRQGGQVLEALSEHLTRVARHWLTDLSESERHEPVPPT